MNINNKFIRFNLYVLLLFSNSRVKCWIYRKIFKMEIGDNCRFTGMPNFGSEPYLIKIGTNVTITQNVRFINHDGAVHVLRKKYPGLNVFQPITVGDNVFFGTNTIILPGVTIGNNVVIGANSIVNKSILDNVVAAGVPAKKLKSIEEYENNIVGSNFIILKKMNFKNKKRTILESLKNKAII